MRLVEHYTDPGDVIDDPFCGSGQTGVAAMLTGRHALISDLSPAAIHNSDDSVRSSLQRAVPRVVSSAARHRMAMATPSAFGRRCRQGLRACGSQRDASRVRCRCPARWTT